TKIKWRTAALFDELAEALDSQRPKRVQGILHQLYRLHFKASEPKLSSMDIVQEEQQQESKEQGEHAVQVEQQQQQQQQGELRVAVAGEEPVALAENHALDSLLLDNDLDMDELEEALEDMDRDANDNDEQEPSRKHLQALGVVLRMLLESPAINFTITASYVSKQAYKGKTFTAKECRVVAMLANTLRPFVPKRRPSETGGFKGPLEHVAARAPFAVLACGVLRYTGYHQFTRSFAPEISPASSQALLLSASGMWETFCSRASGVFDVQDAAGEPLTSRHRVTNPPENKGCCL
ncbi:hypothetical protein BGZ70_005192, partial [Mortierella alpina]